MPDPLGSAHRGPALVLLNGPPAVGKSTVARLLVDRRPLALSLDVDVIRHQLGRWEDDAEAAGLAARRLASSMAATHLSAGAAVVVPQLVARAGFAEELDAVAANVGAAFVEVMLWAELADIRAEFAARSASSTDAASTDAAHLVERTDGDVVGDLYQRLAQRLRREEPDGAVPNGAGPDDPARVVVVAADRGDIATTADRVVEALDHVGVRW
ncbi:MAG: AAA family ATPase [Actinomycetota bacterium]